jgi:cell fate (sporulation/competence/biofilm development) regulator YlbF (YheA/YmcA/DUF963 family)
MGEVEKARKNALELFRTINSFDDVKENREKVRDRIEDIFKAGAAELKRSIEESPNMEPEEAGKLVEEFQKDDFLLNEEIEMEMTRIDSLPGVTDYIAQFESEDEERLEPVIEEFTKHMETLMTIMAGDIMGDMEDVMKGLGTAMGEAIGPMIEGIGEVFTGVSEEAPIKQEAPIKLPWGESFKSEDMIVHSTISRLSSLNMICTVNDLKSQKTFIPFSFKGIFSELLPELKEFKRAIGEDGSSPEEFQDRLDQIEKIKLLAMEGFQTEMERISTIPGASEEVNAIREECMVSIGPAADEIDVLLKEIKG